MACDLSGGVRLTKRVSFFFQGRRIFNDALRIFEAPDGSLCGAALYQYEKYGANWVHARNHVIVIGPGAFDYTPQPVRGVPVVDLADAAQYQVLQPNLRGPNARYVAEPVRISPTTTPEGRPALRFRTYLRGMNDTWLQLAANRVCAVPRTVLTFRARGDAYADLQAIEIVDTKGGRWLSFTPLGGVWRSHAVTLADFLPRGWSQPDPVPPLLNPADIATVSIGIDAATVWREKPMEFSIGAIEFAEDASGRIAPTSRLTALRLPFRENKTAVPSWLFYPFEGTERMAGGPARLIDATDSARVAAVPAWSWPTPLVCDRGDPCDIGGGEWRGCPDAEGQRP